MRIIVLRWRRYRIPFRRPVVTAHGTMSVREGAIVEVVTDAGVTGVGEVAPLPQFGQTLDEALAPLPDLADEVHARPELDSLGRTLQHGDGLPAATLFGLETARLDAQAKARGTHVGGTLPAVPVNATVAVRDADELASHVRDAARQGFAVVKLKVGVCTSVDEEVERICAARSAAPNVRLRLDANEAWSLDQAAEILSRVGRERIEYCEQPLARDDLVGMRRLRESVPVAIAADEAVTDEQSARRVLEAGAADVLVLKPQALGGVAVCRRLVRDLPGGVGWVVTSALEAGVGVNATLHLAALVDLATASSARRLACGLATLDLLEDDLIVKEPRVESGTMYAPRGPGLGVELDRDALAKCAVD